MALAAEGEPEDQRVVENDRFDRLTWRNTLDECPALRQLRVKGEAKRPGFGGLLADLHAGLYKPDPHLLDASAIRANAEWQRAAVERSWDSKEWGQTREASVLDEVLSALGTLAAGNEALKVLDEQVPVLDEQVPPVANTAGTEPADASAAASPMTPQQVRSVARAAAHAAKQEVTEAQQVLAGWGLDQGSLQRLPLGRRIELAQRLMHEAKLRSLAEIVGAMRALAAGLHKRRVTARAAEVVGVELGRDVTRLVPSELARLAHPLLRYESMQRLSSGQALQWRKAERQPQGRGPMIVLCDTSGSTAGRQEVLIKGLALGLLEVAKRQKRNYAGIVFSGPTECLPFEFPVGKVDPEALLDFAVTAFGGGTDWETPLREAMRLQLAAPYRQGDIVLITDGLCRLSEEFTSELLRMKRDRDVRVVGVLAQAGANAHDALDFCDRVIETRDLNAVAAEVLGEVVEERGP